MRVPPPPHNAVLVDAPLGPTIHPLVAMSRDMRENIVTEIDLGNKGGIVHRAHRRLRWMGLATIERWTDRDIGLLRARRGTWIDLLVIAAIRILWPA